MRFKQWAKSHLIGILCNPAFEKVDSRIAGLESTFYTTTCGVV